MSIYILALHGIATGGPEAAHQLSDALIEQGFDARMVYFKWEDLAQGIPPEFPEYGPFAEEYSSYKVNLARALPDEEGNVMVLPETALHLSFAFKRAKVLIWWLSVDNAFNALSGLRAGPQMSPNMNYLRRPNLYHASQSRYAERFVEALGLNSLGMLSDYTVDLTQYATPLPMSERPKLVAFNAQPHKVPPPLIDLEAIGAEIKRIDPEIDLVAIGGLPRKAIADIFAHARVYVDLGNFPGKDRMPREAISMCCCALVANAGAAEETGAFLCLHSDPAKIAREVVGFLTGEPQFVLPHERLIFFTEVRDVFSQLV